MGKKGEFRNHATMKASAKRSARAVAGFKATTGRGELVTMGVFLPMRAKAPPPVSEYEAWFQAEREQADPRGKTAVTGRRLHRAVVMLRGGHGITATAKAVHLSSQILKRWLERLPPELAVDSPPLGPGAAPG